MRKESENGYYYWKRVDGLFPSGAIKELSAMTGIDYVRLINQRSDCRMPKVEDIYLMSKALKTSIEYLVTGEDKQQDATSLSKDIQEVVDVLMLSPSKLASVRVLLGLEDKRGHRESVSSIA